MRQGILRQLDVAKLIEEEEEEVAKYVPF